MSVLNTKSKVKILALHCLEKPLKSRQIKSKSECILRSITAAGFGSSHLIKEEAFDKLTT
jgi:hypothetical protein